MKLSFAPNAALALIFAVLILTIVIMAISLRRMLKVTLYSYKNIMLIGGILFLSVLCIVLTVMLVSALSDGQMTLSDIYRALLDFPRTFSYYAVFVIFFVSILLGISNIALIRHEGFCLNNALSLLVAGFYIGGTLLIYFIADLLKRKVFIPKGMADNPLFLAFGTMIPVFLLLLLCYFECILAGTAIMGYKASKTKPSYDKDFIIILGCSIDKRGGLLPLLKGRVNRAIRFAWEQEIETGKPMKYVPSGGQGENEIMSEGSAMELYLLSHGAEDYEVFPEKKSTSTEENLSFSKRIIDQMKKDAKVAFATTNYHILRSGIIARRAGLDAEGIAGDTKWYFWPNGFVREFFAIISMNIGTHICVAAVTAVVCAIVGAIGFSSGLI